MYIKHCINEIIGTKVSVTMLSKVNRSKTMKKERAISKCNFLGLSDNHPPNPPIPPKTTKLIRALQEKYNIEKVPWEKKLKVRKTDVC